ncbi:Glyoxalase-like domain protein [compost metagenome]
MEVRKGKHTGPVYTFNMGDGRPGLTLDNPSNQPLFNLSVSDINEAFNHVTEMGAEIVTEIITHPDLAEFSFKDPDGNIIMLCTCFS